MDCIDAVEGTAKCVLVKLHRIFVEYTLDDTEYIRNVRAVLEAADMFVQDNKEIVCDPKMLKESLYTYSKTLWSDYMKEIRSREAVSKEGEAVPEDDEYDDYYYDHIYAHGVYPR